MVDGGDVEIVTGAVVKPEVDTLYLGECVNDAGVEGLVAGPDAEIAAIDEIVQEVERYIRRREVYGEVYDYTIIDVADGVIGHHSQTLLSFCECGEVVTCDPFSRLVDGGDIEILSCSVVKPEVDTFYSGGSIKDGDVDSPVVGTSAEIAAIDEIVKEVERYIRRRPIYSEINKPRIIVRIVFSVVGKYSKALQPFCERNHIYLFTKIPDPAIIYRGTVERSSVRELKNHSANI